MELTPETLQAYKDSDAAILQTLGAMARAIYLFRRDDLPPIEFLDTVRDGYPDSWEIFDDHVSVSFYVTGSRGYSDSQTVRFPSSYLAPPAADGAKAWEAPELADRLERQREAKEARAAQSEKKRLAELEALAALKAKYPDA